MCVNPFTHYSIKNRAGPWTVYWNKLDVAPKEYAILITSNCSHKDRHILVAALQITKLDIYGEIVINCILVYLLLNNISAAHPHLK